MAIKTDYCILGAGLAGLSLADSLANRDVSIVVIERSAISAGASGTPGALVNPATGRRATKAWRAEACYEAISDNLRKIAESVKPEAPFYHNNGLLRPALTSKMAHKIKEQYDKTSWPDGWCIWKSETEIKEMHPGINCVDGGLWLPIGISVNAGRYLEAYAGYLKNRGVKLLLNDEPKIESPNNRWLIHVGGDNVQAEHLVFATGHHTTDSRFWDWLPIHAIKGQVAEFELENGTLPFSHSISSLGYISLVGDKRSFVQGSTYEHDFKNLETDRGGEQYLRKRMRRTLPGLEERVQLKSQWAGARASTPNRKPIVGTHPEIENLHVFTGLGSKGLLYSKYLADHLSDHLLNSKSLHPKVSIERLDR